MVNMKRDYGLNFTNYNIKRLLSQWYSGCACPVINRYMRNGIVRRCICTEGGRNSIQRVVECYHTNTRYAYIK